MTEVSRRKMLETTVKLAAGTAVIAAAGIVARKPILHFFRESEKMYADRELAKTTADAMELTRLAESTDQPTRVSVACNQNTQSDVLLVLSKDHDTDVLAQVAKNKNTPGEALDNVCKSDHLGEDRQFIIRDIAAHLNTTTQTLDYISKLRAVDGPEDGLEEAKVIVAGRTNTSWKTIMHLAEDPNLQVRTAAIETLSKRIKLGINTMR